jgi:hypothetical protein
MDFHLIGNLRDFANDVRVDLHSISHSLIEIQESLNEQNKTKANDCANNAELESNPAALELRFPRTLHTHTVLDSKQYEPFEWLKFGVNTLTLFAVLGYTALAAYQWIEMKKSADSAQTTADAARSANETAREALTAVQRAFVFMEGTDVEVVHTPSGTQGVIFDFKWENSGTTPAKLFSGHLNYRFQDNPMGEDFSLKDQWEPGIRRVNVEGFIGPKGVLRMPLDYPIPIPIMTSLALRKGHFYVWGWAKYHDVFANTPEHITKFCVDVTPVDFHVESGISKFTERLDACPRRGSNCVDDQCRL